MHYQKSLPRLPIPELSKTCERYLQSLRPLQDNFDISKTEKIVQRLDIFALLVDLFHTLSSFFFLDVVCNILWFGIVFITDDVSSVLFHSSHLNYDFYSFYGLYSSYW